MLLFTMSPRNCTLKKVEDLNLHRKKELYLMNKTEICLYVRNLQLSLKRKKNNKKLLFYILIPIRAYRKLDIAVTEFKMF